MSYSRQESNGTVVENVDGEIYVNGRHIKTGKISKAYYTFKVIGWIIFLALGCVLGRISI